ncbi:MAG: excinuclease ABC subunit UvrB [Chlamydia sp.]
MSHNITKNQFVLNAPFSPCGDQIEAIQQLTAGITEGKRSQVLLGVTGSGKTFTMANVIANVQKPTLIIAHNKTLAAQLYQEFKEFFPSNAVEYFVSYYDYYQPEAYIARTDTYIEKDFAINDRIDRLRLSATRSLLERSDAIIVSSVSCIYGLGSPEYYRQMNLHLKIGEERKRDLILLQLVEMQYTRNDFDFSRATFRSRGDVLDVFPAYEDDTAIRIQFFGDEVEEIWTLDPLTGKKREKLKEVTIYAGSHHVTPEDVRLQAVETIKQELREQSERFSAEDKLIEAQRIKERVGYDLEMIQEVGFCKGIENYSRHFSQREAGAPPPCLIDYFPKDYLLIIDESHQTMPQIGAMCNGDRARKSSLIEYGFRLPSAFDNRPLSSLEVQSRMNQTIYVSATPALWEVERANGEIVEQIIRPTGLLDPIIEVRPSSTQVDDVLQEIRREIAKKESRVLVTTLTKRLSEELSKYMEELGIRARYLHSDIDTLERLQIIHDLRSGVFDVLIGINLLREGLDIPEVTLVCILDADKEGFLRSETALTQICGRAARNQEGRVIMYADKETKSIQKTINVTQTRRQKQIEYNKLHGITPKTVKKKRGLFGVFQEEPSKKKSSSRQKPSASDIESFFEEEKYDMKILQKRIKEWESNMKSAAKELRFEDATHARDTIKRLQALELEWSELGL